VTDQTLGASRLGLHDESEVISGTYARCWLILQRIQLVQLSTSDSSEPDWDAFQVREMNDRVGVEEKPLAQRRSFRYDCRGWSVGGNRPSRGKGRSRGKSTGLGLPAAVAAADVI